MVKKYKFFCLFIILFSSCNFFLRTPFNNDITNFDSISDISSNLTNTYEQSTYSLKIIKNVICLKVENTDSPAHQYLFHTENFEFITDQEGNTGSLIMIDVNQNLNIGNQQWSANLLQQVSFTDIPSDHFGFSDANYNYEIFSTATQLNFNVYDSNYQPVNTYAIPIDNGYWLNNIFCSYSDTINSRFLILQFYVNNDKNEILRIPLSDTPLTFPNDYPFGYQKIYLPDSTDNYYNFTNTGFIIKGWTGYYYYSYDYSIIKKMDTNMDNQYNLLAFDPEGAFYYRFNIKTGELSKYSVWW